MIRAALCGIALAAYSNSFGTGFVFDSAPIVLKDPRIRTVSTENLGLIFSKDYFWPHTSGVGVYRPVTTLSLLLNYAVLGNGESPGGYHWVNLLLHVINVWLVFALALRLFGRDRPAFLAAALWAVHPINTEAVTNVVNRTDLLAAMAVLSGLLLYSRSLDAGKGMRYRGALALFAVAAAGMFSKESGVAIAGMLPLWDISFGTGDWRAGARRRIPTYAAVAAALGLLWWGRHTVFRQLPWGEIPFIDNPIAWADFWPAKLTAIQVIGLDLRLLLWPGPLACDRSFNEIPLAGWTDPGAWLALLVVAAILTAAVVRRRGDRLMFFAAGFFGIALAPVANLLMPVGTMIGERFLYLPSVAFAIAVVALAYRAGRPRFAEASLAVLILVYGCRTWMRNPDWTSELTLAAADVRTAPGSFRIHEMLAHALSEANAKANIDEAIRQQEMAWRILRPVPARFGYQQAPANLGGYYIAKGDLTGGAATPEGRAWYEKAVAVLTEGEGISRVVERHYDEAQRAHGKPLENRAAMPNLYLNLGAAYAELGRNAEAIRAFRYGRNVNPQSADAYDGLAGAYLAEGKVEWAAISMVEKAQVDGAQAATLSALRAIYARIPEGACAVKEGGLNLECPRVRADTCTAWVDLAQAFAEARQTAASVGFTQRAAAFGCR
jgi:tetratricopeptide (TPR) repeat protein